MDPSEYSDWDYEYFFEQCYEEYVLYKQINEKFKAFSDGIEAALDQIQAELADELLEEEDEQTGFDSGD